MKKYLTYTEEETLEAVKQDGDALRYVENYYQSVADITNEEDYNSLKKAN